MEQRGGTQGWYLRRR
jgi:hypothetical protein